MLCVSRVHQKFAVLANSNKCITNTRREWHVVFHARAPRVSYTACAAVIVTLRFCSYKYVSHHMLHAWFFRVISNPDYGFHNKLKLYTSAQKVLVKKIHFYFLRQICSARQWILWKPFFLLWLKPDTKCNMQKNEKFTPHFSKNQVSWIKWSE